MDLPLRDIHLPEAISWWPLAIGWWLVIAAFMIVVLGGSFLLWRALRPTLRKEASLVLDEIENAFQVNEDAHVCLSELSKFLRRAAISQKDRLKIGGLTGEPWLHILDRQMGKPEFSQGPGRILLTGPYCPQADKEQVFEVIQLCRKWVKKL